MVKLHIMSMMISELYDALKEAGSSEDKARLAASAVADFNEAINDIKQVIKELKGELTLPKWMIGFNLAFTMVVVWKVFT